MWLDDILWLWSAFFRLISLTHFFHREKRPWLSIHERDTSRHTVQKRNESSLSRIVSLHHATICTTCRSFGFIWCIRDISSSILANVALPDKHSLDGVLQIETAGCEQTDAQSERNNWRNGIISLADAESR